MSVVRDLFALIEQNLKFELSNGGEMYEFFVSPHMMRCLEICYERPTGGDRQMVKTGPSTFLCRLGKYEIKVSVSPSFRSLPTYYDDHLEIPKDWDVLSEKIKEENKRLNKKRHPKAKAPTKINPFLLELESL